MNAVDVFLLVVILISIWMGWRRGAIAGFTDLFIWLGSLLIGIFFYKPVASWLLSVFPSLNIWSNAIAFLTVILASRFFLSLLFARLLPARDSNIEAKTVNKAFGVIPGFINGVVNAMIIAALLLFLPLSNIIQSTAKDSQVATLLGGHLEWFDEKLSPIFDPVVKKAAQAKAVYPDSNSTTKLNFTVTKVRERADLEQEMLVLVNKERTEQGLSELQWDASLLPAARSHSKDMFARGYFSHYSLEGKTVSDRLRASKVRFLVAGENLALAQSITMAHEGLMNSPGHRANILHKSYGRIAIGVIDGGIHGIMVTQVFKN